MKIWRKARKSLRSVENLHKINQFPRVTAYNAPLYIPTLLYMQEKKLPKIRGNNWLCMVINQVFLRFCLIIYTIKIQILYKNYPINLHILNRQLFSLVNVRLHCGIDAFAFRLWQPVQQLVCKKHFFSLPNSNNDCYEYVDARYG